MLLTQHPSIVHLCQRVTNKSLLVAMGDVKCIITAAEPSVGKSPQHQDTRFKTSHKTNTTEVKGIICSNGKCWRWFRTENRKEPGLLVWVWWDPLCPLKSEVSFSFPYLFPSALQLWDTEVTDFKTCSINQFTFNLWVTFEGNQQLWLNISVLKSFAAPTGFPIVTTAGAHGYRSV